MQIGTPHLIMSRRNAASAEAPIDRLTAELVLLICKHLPLGGVLRRRLILMGRGSKEWREAVREWVCLVCFQ